MKVGSFQAVEIIQSCESWVTNLKAFGYALMRRIHFANIDLFRCQTGQIRSRVVPSGQRYDDVATGDVMNIRLKLTKTKRGGEWSTYPL